MQRLRGSSCLPGVTLITVTTPTACLHKVNHPTWVSGTRHHPVHFLTQAQADDAEQQEQQQQLPEAEPAMLERTASHAHVPHLTVQQFSCLKTAERKVFVRVLIPCIFLMVANYLDR